MLRLIFDTLWFIIKLTSQDPTGNTGLAFTLFSGDIKVEPIMSITLSVKGEVALN